MRVLLWLGVSSLLTSCLLVTSLDGLEGPASGTAGVSGTAGTDLTTVGGSGSGGEPSDAPVTPVVFQDRRAVQGGGIPIGIALADADVYWVERMPVGILRAPKNGSAAPVHVDTLTDSLPMGLFDVAVDSTSIYWSTSSYIVRYKPRDSGSEATANDYFSAGVPTAYLALGEPGNLYATDYTPGGGGGNVIWGTLNTAQRAWMATTGPVTGIAWCANRLYWGLKQSNIAGAQVDGSNISPPNEGVVIDQISVSGVACDSEYIYWIDDNRVVRSKNISSGVLKDLYVYSPQPEDGIPTDSGVGDIAVDIDWIYFTQPATKRIYKLSKSILAR